MYNRYIPNGAAYVRIPEDRDAPASPRESARSGNSGQPGGQRQGNRKGGTPPLDIGALLRMGGKKEHAGGLSGMLKALKLDDLDTGDILLMLILLFLFLEGDNTELIITLGLMLLLGLGEEEKKENQ